VSVSDLDQRGYAFSLVVGGSVNATAYFTSVDGLQNASASEHPAVTADGHEYVQMQPGRVKWGEITFRRGIVKDLALWRWREMVTDGGVPAAHASATITLYDREYKPQRVWFFAVAWPSKLSGPSSEGEPGEFGIEELTLHHEGMNMPRDWSGGQPG